MVWANPAYTWYSKGIFGRDITKYTVTYGVYLHIYNSGQPQAHVYLYIICVPADRLISHIHTSSDTCGASVPCTGTSTSTATGHFHRHLVQHVSIICAPAQEQRCCRPLFRHPLRHQASLLVHTIAERRWLCVPLFRQPFIQRASLLVHKIAE